MPGHGTCTIAEQDSMHRWLVKQIQQYPLKSWKAKMSIIVIYFKLVGDNVFPRGCE